MPKAAKAKVTKPPTRAIVEEACYYAEDQKGLSQHKILQAGEEQGYFNSEDGRTKASVKKAIEALVSEGRLVQTKQYYSLSKEARSEYDELAESSGEEVEVEVKKTPAKKKTTASAPKTKSAPKKKTKK